jgi:hypothetical protein
MVSSRERELVTKERFIQLGKKGVKNLPVSTGCWLTGSIKIDFEANSTWDSQAVSNPSTIQAQAWLTSVI